MAEIPEFAEPVLRPSDADPSELPEADSGLALTVGPPRLVPLTAEQHTAAVALLAELFDQWRRARSAQT